MVCISSCSLLQPDKLVCFQPARGGCTFKKNIKVRRQLAACSLLEQIKAWRKWLEMWKLVTILFIEGVIKTSKQRFFRSMLGCCWQATSLKNAPLPANLTIKKPKMSFSSRRSVDEGRRKNSDLVAENPKRFFHETKQFYADFFLEIARHTYTHTNEYNSSFCEYILYFIFVHISRPLSLYLLFVSIFCLALFTLFLSLVNLFWKIIFLSKVFI